MKKVLSLTAAAIALLAVSAHGAEPKVLWNKTALENGTLTAELAYAPSGEKAILAYYHDGALDNVNTVYVSEDGTAKLSLRTINPKSGDKACVYIWDDETMMPLCAAVSEITPNGASGNLREIWYSDDQKTNKATSVAYHSFDEQTALYKAEIDITIAKSGDLALMFGDSANGNLTYSNSAAILLFNGGKFTVKNGNGSGAYTDNGTVLCNANVGETYHIEFSGNVAENTYTVKITDKNGATYESKTLTARKNAAKIDIVGLVSNSTKTVVSGNNYSGYCFTGEEFSVKEIEPEKEIIEYTGFAGRYYAVQVASTGRYVRGNNGRLTADYSTVRDNSAEFMARDMADGGIAFECASSKNRMTDSGEVQLKSSAYNTENMSQHWQLIESENYSADNQTYYLKNLMTEKYITLSGNNLGAGAESNKAELRFVPLDDKSKLVKVSKMGCYELLSKNQRKRIETLYSTVAGDIFGRYGERTEWNFRIRIENVLDEILEGSLTDEQAASKLEGLLTPENNHLFQNSAHSGAVSSSLPGVKGVTAEKGQGTDGEYDFWRGTMLKGTKYPLNIYGEDGQLQQTITLYVHNDATAKHNADSFCAMVAQIPQPMRKYLKNVKIRNDTANSFNGGGTDLYIRVNWKQTPDDVKSTVFHELGHILDSNAASGWWSGGSGWKKAMEADMVCASEYARSSNAEDFAEFNRLYFACWGNQDKQIGLQIVFPERYASYYRLRHSVLNGYELWEDTEYLPQYIEGEFR